MSISAISMVTTVLSGVVLSVAIWVGVVVLAKTGRTLSWWAMLIGLVLSTLGGVLCVILTWVSMRSLSHSVSSSGGIAMTPSTNLAAVLGAGLCMIVAMLGLVMFGVGFALHAFQMARLARRAAELETLCASMMAHGGAGP